jgi:hypothetical protein
MAAGDNAFVGWWRPNAESRWRIVYDSATAADCQWRLDSCFGNQGEKLVLPNGVEANAGSLIRDVQHVPCCQNGLYDPPGSSNQRRRA